MYVLTRERNEGAVVLQVSQGAFLHIVVIVGEGKGGSGDVVDYDSLRVWGGNNCPVKATYSTEEHLSNDKTMTNAHHDWVTWLLTLST